MFSKQFLSPANIKLVYSEKKLQDIWEILYKSIFPFDAVSCSKSAMIILS